MKKTENPLRELTGYLARLADKCRASRAFEILFPVTVAQDIAADVARSQAAAGALVYTAQQEDLEAARLIEDAGRDGFSAADLPALTRALRLVRASAKHDAAAGARLTA